MYIGGGGSLLEGGMLDRRVQFRRATLADDGLTQALTFADHGNPIWAKKTEISDGERWRAGEVAAQMTTRFVVRYGAFTAAITPKDQLTCEGRTYEISGIKEITTGRKRWLEITAAARVDA